MHTILPISGEFKVHTLAHLSVHVNADKSFFLLSHPLLRLFMWCVDHLASGLETLNMLLFYSQELRYTTSTSALSCYTDAIKW